MGPMVISVGPIFVPRTLMRALAIARKNRLHKPVDTILGRSRIYTQKLRNTLYLFETYDNRFTLFKSIKQRI